MILGTSSVALLGFNYGCYWKDPSTLVVNMGENFLLVPGNTLTLLSGSIQSADSLSTNVASTVVVLRSSTITAVAVTIVGDTIIGTCGGVVDLTANTKGYSWSIVNHTDSGWKNSLNAFAQATTTNVFALNGSVVPLGEDVTVALSITNWLKDSASTRFEISKVSAIVPSLTLPSSNNITTKRSRVTDINIQVNVQRDAESIWDLTIIANIGSNWVLILDPKQRNEMVTSKVRTPKCVNNLRVDVLWSQLAGPPISISNPRSAYLRIPAFSLQTYSTYLLEFTAKTVSLQTNATLGQQSVTIVLHVEDEPLEAIIAGGTSRTIPVISQSPYSVSFDASSSVDPAYPVGSTLSFSWSLFDNSSTSVTPFHSNGSVLTLSTAQLAGDR
eukprot:jgi/Bigna1/133029/aug1.19_g7737